MNWYENLMFYGFDEKLGIDALRKDSDVNLVPMVVEKVMVTKITCNYGYAFFNF